MWQRYDIRRRKGCAWLLLACLIVQGLEQSSAQANSLPETMEGSVVEQSSTSIRDSPGANHSVILEKKPLPDSGGTKKDMPRHSGFDGDVSHFTVANQPTEVVASNHSHAESGAHNHSGTDIAGHDHSKCGHNLAVAPWMAQQLQIFDIGKAADRAIAATSVKAAVGGSAPAPAAEIRIHTEFQLDNIEDLSKRHFLKHQLVPRMVAEIRRRIHVKAPVQGNLKIPRYCAMYYIREDGSYACAKIADQDYCSSPEIGIRHNPKYLDGFTLCENTDHSSCNAYQGGSGAANSDFVLYIASNEVGFCEQGHIVAFAGTCALDLASNRPLAGFANFCPKNIETDPAKFQDLLETAIHEALHALFFSELLFPYFVDSAGEQRSEVVKVGLDGRKMVVTPSVRQAARDHFGCDTLEGALLENEGGEGTAGNHWESKVFKGELMDGMSGAPNERAVFSALTMALIDDTGWYKANWDLKGRLGFGRDAGCAFVSRDCTHRIDQTSGGAQWFCPKGSTQDACSWDLKSVGQCSAEQLLDGCTTTVAYRNMHCQQKSLEVEREDGNSWLWGYSYGPNSRCMQEIGPLTKIPGDGYKYTKFAGPSNLDCYRFTCQDGKNLHLLLGEHEIPCPSGQDVDLRPLGYVSGILGPCPDNQDLCSQLSCPNLCSGNGDCHQGKCFCALGYAGEDCSERTCLQDSCANGLKCNPNSGTCKPTSPKDSEQIHGCPVEVLEAADWDAFSYLVGISSEDFSYCYPDQYSAANKESMQTPEPELEAPPIDIARNFGADWGDEEPLPDQSLRDKGNDAQLQGNSSNTHMKQQPNETRPSSPASPSSVGPDHIEGSQHDTETMDADTNSNVINGVRWGNASSEESSMAKANQIPEAQSDVTHKLQPGGIDGAPRNETAQAEQPPYRMQGLPDRNVVSERIMATLHLLQLDGDRAMSTIQAENLKQVLAHATGVSKDAISFTDLELPSTEGSAYILDAKIESPDVARVVTSLRNAYSYGILRTKIKTDVKMDCIGIDFNAEDDAAGQALGWIIGFSILGSLLLAGILGCLVITSTACCNKHRWTQGKHGNMTGQTRIHLREDEKKVASKAMMSKNDSVPQANRRIMKPVVLQDHGPAMLNPKQTVRGAPSLNMEIESTLRSKYLHWVGEELEEGCQAQKSNNLATKSRIDVEPHDRTQTRFCTHSSNPCSDLPCSDQAEPQSHARIAEKPRSPSSAARMPETL